MKKTPPIAAKECPSQAFYSAQVVQLSELLIKKADQILNRTCDLTLSQFNILFLLQHQGTLSQQALAQQLHLTPAAISRLTETLMAKKYVSRKENPSNRRQNCVDLTSTGNTKVTTAINLLQDLEKQLYHSVGEHELTIFLNTVKHLTSHLTTSYIEEKLTQA